MKLNNRGFAISGILYAIMFLFITLIFAVLGLLGSRKIVLDKYKQEVSNKLENNEIIENAAKIDKSGANTPQLLIGMIPVIYNGSNWVKADYKSEYDQNWYNYEEKKWANVVLVNESSRNTYQNASAGYTINDDDILAFYVWIPRFSYKLFNANANVLCSTISNLGVSYNDIYPLCYNGATYNANNYTYGGVIEQQIDIKFEKVNSIKSDGANNLEYKTHPAFTFGTKELSGIWVSKYEITGNIDKITVLPNNQPIVSKSISELFYAVRNIESDNNIYGLNSNEVDSHIIKNIEWGAVAYLTQSRYGKCNNKTCLEIGINNYYDSGLKTGCGNNPGSASNNTCNSYVNALASTTGNITGIYDMSGGAWEYVMANMQNETKNFEANNSGFTESINNIYYDSYDYITNSLDLSKSKLGDGIRETVKVYNSLTGGWYYDNVQIFNNENYWLRRGGSYSDLNGSGLFSSYFTSGSADINTTTRTVITYEY